MGEDSHYHWLLLAARSAGRWAVRGSVLSLLLLSACLRLGGGPTIKEFTAEPSQMHAGEQVTLRWQVEGGNDITLRLTARNRSTGSEQRITLSRGQESFTDMPVASTDYTLTAEGGLGMRDQREVRVTVLPSGAPRIRSFSASSGATPVAAGTEVTLSWEVEGAERVTLDGEAVQPNASVTVRPTVTTTYVLQAHNDVVSEPVTRRVTVEVAGGGGPGVEIERFAAEPGTVEPGGEAVLSWRVTGAERLELSSNRGLAAVDVTGETSYAVAPTVTTEYTLTARRGSETVTGRATVVVRHAPGEGPILLLVAGQSNAQGVGYEEGGEFPVPGETETAADDVWLLDAPTGTGESEWEWVPAEEPTHEGGSHSFVVRLGNVVRAHTGREVYLLPTAVGGSDLREWLAGRELYEAARERAAFAARDLGVDVSAVIWFQGESETREAGRRSAYNRRTAQVFESFREDLPGAPLIIYAQLAKRFEDPARNLAYQEVREHQRLLEGGAVTADVDGARPSEAAEEAYWMVVTHDLPLSDDKHVSAEGQRELGSRIALTYLSAVEGLGPEGWQGPRLAGVTTRGDAIAVTTTTPLRAPADGFDGYFAVFSGDQELEILSAHLDQADPSTVLLTFPEGTLADRSDLTVRYMPPPDTPEYAWSEDAVRATSVPDGYGLTRPLPLPAFGLPVEELKPYFLEPY